MTQWTPEFNVIIDGVSVTDIVLTGLSITSGRTDINSQPQAGYANISIINTSNAYRTWNVSSTVTIEVKNASNTFIPLFGGKVSDISVAVRSAGANGFVTDYSILAIGAISKMSKAVWTSALSQDKDGDQIFAILSDLLLNTWNELPAAEQWSTYNPTETWADGGDVGLGEIDRPGQYTMEQQNAGAVDFYTAVTNIANSALGYIYEDSLGNIGYADAAHRGLYLINNGYVELDARNALGVGIKQTTRGGSIVNSYQINYGNNFNSSKSALDQNSINLYGLYAVQQNSYIHNATDAQNIVDRQISLRAYPRATFESITFPIQNPELSDAQRNALIAIFMGLPVKITNLPLNISGGEFTGYVEGWTFVATLSGLSLTFFASPTEFSAVSQYWEQVSASESWNSITNTLEWQNAIGVIG